MRTSHLAKGISYFLTIALFTTISLLLSSCSDTGTTTSDPAKTSATCSPVWGTWELTYPDRTSDADKATQKSAMEDSVKSYVTNTDTLGNSCRISAMNWNDSDSLHSTLTVCIACLDKDLRVIAGDTTPIRPPMGVKPPAGLTYKLVEPR